MELASKSYTNKKGETAREKRSIKMHMYYFNIFMLLLKLMLIELRPEQASYNAAIGSMVSFIMKRVIDLIFKMKCSFSD